MCSRSLFRKAEGFGRSPTGNKDPFTWYYDAKSDLAEAQGDGTESCRYFDKMDATLGQAIELKQQLEERGVKVD